MNMSLTHSTKPGNSVRIYQCDSCGAQFTNARCEGEPLSTAELSDLLPRDIAPFPTIDTCDECGSCRKISNKRSEAFALSDILRSLLISRGLKVQNMGVRVDKDSSFIVAYVPDYKNLGRIPAEYRGFPVKISVGGAVPFLDAEGLAVSRNLEIDDVIMQGGLR